MAEPSHTHRASLLGLPAELRLIVYAHLTEPAMQYRDVNWDERSRHWYKNVYKNVLPETKLIYFTLHALSAACSTLHREMVGPVEEVRTMLAKQKYYLQSRLTITHHEWMKCSGMTWEELEAEMGIARGPDFTCGFSDLHDSDVISAELQVLLDQYGGSVSSHHGLWLLASSKRWQKMMDEKHGPGYRRWRGLIRSKDAS